MSHPSQEAQGLYEGESQIDETQCVHAELEGMQQLPQGAVVNVNASCVKRLQQNADASFRALSDYEAKRQRLSRIEKTMEELEKQKNELERGIKTTKTHVQNEETRIKEALRLCFERQTENKKEARKIIAQECELAELQKEIDETAANMNKCRREIQDL
jgi:chromosome segregation ATPase